VARAAWVQYSLADRACQLLYAPLLRTPFAFLGICLACYAAGRMLLQQNMPLFRTSVYAYRFPITISIPLPKLYAITLAACWLARYHNIPIICLRDVSLITDSSACLRTFFAFNVLSILSVVFMLDAVTRHLWRLGSGPDDYLFRHFLAHFYAFIC